LIIFKLLYAGSLNFLISDETSYPNEGITNATIYLSTIILA